MVAKWVIDFLDSEAAGGRNNDSTSYRGTSCWFVVHLSPWKALDVTACGDVGLLHETDVDVVVVDIFGHEAICVFAFGRFALQIRMVSLELRVSGTFDMLVRVNLYGC